MAEGIWPTAGGCLAREAAIGLGTGNTVIEPRVLLQALILCALAACGGRPDTLATSVAGTVAVAPTQASTATAVAIAPTASATSPLPTATPEPSATPVPTQTPVPSPTLSSDPKAALGPPAFRDTFEAAGEWAVWDDDGSSGQVVDGQYVMVVAQTGGYRYSLRPLVGSDFYVEVTARVGDCRPGDSYGLLFRVQRDTISGYYYTASCDGRFRLFKMLSGQADPVVLVDWTSADAIARGPNATNVLGIYGRKNQIALYANGQLLTSIPDSSFASGVSAGLYARASTAPVTVSFDDFSVWPLND